MSVIQKQKAMKPINNEPNTLDNVKINVKFKLSALWIAVMFIYVYADIKVFFQPGLIDDIRSGKIAGMEINQIFLLCSAIIMTIPSLMIFLSLFLKPKFNRAINMVLGIVYTLIIISTYLLKGEGDIWAYYVLYNTIEIILTIMIVWHAFNWPKKQV
jgi:hypothetical protein